MNQPSSHGVAARDAGSGITSDLVDLTSVRLADLLALDRQAIQPVMGRLLRRIDDPASITSGYNPQRWD